MQRHLAFVVTFIGLISPALAQPVESFESFIKNFEPTAVAAGVTHETYAKAMYGLTPDPNVPALVTAQPEFTTPLWDYIEKRVTAWRLDKGKEAIAENKALLEATGKKYGVDPYLLASIWGIETNYGRVLGDPQYIRPIIPSLATLVHQRRVRLEGDTADLIAALLLVQRGPLDATQLVGSWAGAIGHLQVNPSNVIKYGTDGDGDGAVDLHNSLADALATSATYIIGLGYKPGLDWGYEVDVPEGFDYLLATRDQLRPISFFTELGVKRVGGGAFSDSSIPVFLYAPTGAKGPKFLMTNNYLILKGYNFSDSYAMAISHLEDRLQGRGEYVTAWPRETKFPNLEQRRAIQEALIKLGLYEGLVDGRIGPVSQAAYAKFQASKGEVADGFITLQSYEELVAAAGQ
ncbi:MAG TPA: lytic murein transglycosylase [Devosia sp.]|jgi:membrane-bound lytic murein transglycosylase B|uniref:lytic murein transglycosylase n=1 Tax=Devosia sp. TaxID=1871048 RepID=UPI002DDCB564|nr:lytic murein transglycosylase [Devosia sp.]HEV2515343.1 lytic murein transglycosylase [Devosia sp.]